MPGEPYMDIVHQLRMAKGGLAKIKILKRHEDNEEWKNILWYMYNTSINYYIGPPVDTTFKTEPIEFSAMAFLLDALRHRQYTGHDAKRVALEGSRRFGEIFRLILGGSLKSNVAEATINKVYPGLIPVFQIMLARDVPVVKWPVVLSTKYDGVRLVISVENGAVLIQTRHGKELRIDSLTRECEFLPDGVYDSEIVLGNGLLKDRSSISGFVTKCIRGTSNDIPGYSCCMFDYVSLEEWKQQKCTLNYKDRMSLLSKYIKLISNRKHVKLATMSLHQHQESIDEKYTDLVNRGYEGIILRYPDGMYEWKRTNNLIKKKAIKEAVLLVTGTLMGKEGTKQEGLIGSLVCEGDVEDQFVKVNIGSGLNLHDIEKHPEEFIGRDIEIEYNSITTNKKDSSKSLFLARFKRIKGELDT